MALSSKQIIKRKVLKCILFFLLIAIFITLIIIYDNNLEWFNAHIFYRFLLFALLLVLPIVTIILFLKSQLITNFLRPTSKDMEKYHKLNNDNLRIYNSLIVDKNKYAEQKTMYLHSNWINGLMICIPTASYLTIFIIKIGINIYAVIIAMFLLVMLHIFFGRFIIISSKGILSKSLLKNQLLNWNEIENISLSTFNIQAGSELLILINGRKRIKSNSRMVVSTKIGSYFWPKMIHHIMAYWDEEIVNLHNVKCWRRCLQKNGTAIK